MEPTQEQIEPIAWYYEQFVGDTTKSKVLTFIRPYEGTTINNLQPLYSKEQVLKLIERANAQPQQSSVE